MSSSIVPPKLEISAQPFLHQGLHTPTVMLEVLLALIPIFFASLYFFGITALFLLLATTSGAVLTEWIFKGRSSLKDNTALLTGVLLGFTLPPTIPLWMGFLGGFIAIALGKLIWGGLGQNIFNPALVGRVFLQAAFPTAMTTWVVPESFFQVKGSSLAFPLFQSNMVDSVTTASPLGDFKFGGHHAIAHTWDIFIGHTSGSLGETSALLLILAGLWLTWRKIFDWRLMVSTLIGVALFSGLLHLVNPSIYPPPIFMLFSGGLLFGAVFMVTDPVTTPITPKGAWIFGFGVAFFVVLIRIFGGLPEGMMFSILLMNSVTPLINRYTQPRVFGG